MLGLQHFTDYSLSVRLLPILTGLHFFKHGSLTGKFPQILDDEVVGVEAPNVFIADATEMLKEIITNKWLKANGVIGIWPANSVDGDTVEVYNPDGSGEVIHRFEFMRQQIKKGQRATQFVTGRFYCSKRFGNYRLYRWVCGEHGFWN